MDSRKGKTYRRPKTDEARERGNAYRREYARLHPEKVRQWRLRYAQNLIEREAKGGGEA